MKARLLRDMDCRPTEAFPDGIKPAGTIIDHPQAYWLVRMGVAEAVDEECEQAAGMSADKLAAARLAYPKVEAGLQPEDYEAWDAGLMRGYNPDGTWIPGPNYEEEIDLAEELELEDEEESDE